MIQSAFILRRTTSNFADLRWVRVRHLVLLVGAACTAAAGGVCSPLIQSVSTIRHGWRASLCAASCALASQFSYVFRRRTIPRRGTRPGCLGRADATPAPRGGPFGWHSSARRLRPALRSPSRTAARMVKLIAPEEKPRQTTFPSASRSCNRRRRALPVSHSSTGNLSSSP